MVVVWCSGGNDDDHHPLKKWTMNEKPSERWSWAIGQRMYVDCDYIIVNIHHHHPLQEELSARRRVTHPRFKYKKWCLFNNLSHSYTLTLRTECEWVNLQSGWPRRQYQPHQNVGLRYRNGWLACFDRALSSCQVNYLTVAAVTNYMLRIVDGGNLNLCRSRGKTAVSHSVTTADMGTWWMDKKYLIVVVMVGHRAKTNNRQ